MSIPGLGQAVPSAVAAAAAASQATTTTIALPQFGEYRFEVPASTTLTIRLLKGLAEKDGTELAPNTPYVFTRTKSKINTWHGCELEASSPDPGAYHGRVASPQAHETNLVPYLNLHMSLDGMRAHARQALAAAPGRDPGAMGPRLLVAGPPSSGKTTLVKTLAAWATRMGAQPMVVNTDPAQGMLSLPGTLSAAVFATLMDVTTEWGGTPNSGPTAIPVKLPLAYYYGLARPEDNPPLYRSQLSRLAAAATGRLAEDHDVRASGMLIDTGSIDVTKGGYDFLAHIVAEYSVNIIVTLGSDRMRDELATRFAGQRTTLGEEISIVGLDKCSGVVERNPIFMQGVMEAAVKEYFFGDARRSLNPHTQQISFEAVSIWKVSEEPESKTDGDGEDDDDFYDPASTGSSSALVKVEPSVAMTSCILAVVYAGIRDAPDTIRDANVMGFVWVASVDEAKRKLRLTAPVNARLGDRPLVWGSYPEPVVGLTG